MNTLSLFVIVLLVSLAAIALAVFVASNLLSVMAKDSDTFSGDSGGSSGSSGGDSNSNSNDNSDPVES